MVASKRKAAHGVGLPVVEALCRVGGVSNASAVKFIVLGRAHFVRHQLQTHVQ